jgi:L-ascorbate metabolism protein UlaG (beta-lactamase superfamily)
MKFISLILLSLLPFIATAQQHPDVYMTPMGPLVVTPVNHGSVMLRIKGKVIHVDPYEKSVDYATLPKADLVLITHEHSDHYDKKALDKVTKADTHIIATGSVVAAGLKGASVLKNGESTLWNDIRIDAVPAYNIEHKSPNGKPFHEKGVGNGYILSFKNYRVYIAGDTENIPEMSKLGKIQVAFLPKNLPYTMTNEQFVEAAKIIRPKALYAYHYFELDRDLLIKLLPKSIELK